MTDLMLNSSDSDDNDSDYIPEDEKIINNEINPFTHSDATENMSRRISPSSSTVEERARAEKLWKQFLDDEVDACSSENVTATTTTSKATIKCTVTSAPKNLQTMASDSTICLEIDTSEQENIVSILDKSTVCRKEENASIASPQNSSFMKRGLDSLLGKMQNKKHKMTTLQKSLIDWESFKKDEGISADLQTFNKGKRGYLERQAFLKRSDLRSFEVEKSLQLHKK